MEKKPGNRIEEIDALRGIAAVFVLLFHQSKIYDRRHHLTNSLGFHFAIGYYGVYLFFVISGFVILLTLHRCRTGLDFAVSRFSRIFPAYWGGILVTSGALHLLGSPLAPGLPQMALNFTMLERFFGFQHVDTVYWTLNVELSFYVWILLVFKAGWLDKIQRVIPVVLAVQGALALGAHASGHVFSQEAKDVFLLEYAHLFCAGMLFYDAREHGFTPWRLFLLAWCFFNQTIAPFRSFDWMLPDGWGDASILIIFLIMYLVVSGRLRWLAHPVLLYLGTISYTLYLLHNEIGNAVMEELAAMGVPRWPGFLLTTAIALLLATLLTFVVEKPAMAWIRSRYRQWKTGGGT